MLFINSKYESLQNILERTNVVNEVEVADEEISDKGFTKFKKLVQSDPNSDLLSDDEVKDYKDTVVKYGYKQSLTKYDGFFEEHDIVGIKKLVFDAFLQADKAEELKKILEKGYLFTVDDLLGGKNIYDFCTDFVDVAKELIKYEGTAGGKTFGKGELLLRMFLKDGHTPQVGDVGIGDKLMEVKAVQSTTYAHPTTQDTLKEEVLYREIDMVFKAKGVPLKVGDKDYEPGSVNYADQKLISVFNDNVKEFIKNKGKLPDLINAMCKGIAVQYGGVINAGATSSLPKIVNEYKTALKSGEMKYSDFREMIGRMQVLAYASHYDYFMVMNYTNGNYVITDNDYDRIIATSKMITYGSFGGAKARAGAGIGCK